MPTRIPRWAQWFDGHRVEDRAINANADELLSVEASVSRHGDWLARQERELTMLRALVAGLSQLLVAKGVCTEDEIDSVVIEIARANAVAADSTTCVRCGATVPLASTNVTTEGNVCDQCSG